MLKKLLHGVFGRASFVISLSVAESLDLRRPAIQGLDNLLKSRQRKLADRSILGYTNGLLPNPASGSWRIVQSLPSDAGRKVGNEQSASFRWRDL